jgi:hypothetical protein
MVNGFAESMNCTSISDGCLVDCFVFVVLKIKGLLALRGISVCL